MTKYPGMNPSCAREVNMFYNPKKGCYSSTVINVYMVDLLDMNGFL